MLLTTLSRVPGFRVARHCGVVFTAAVPKFAWDFRERELLYRAAMWKAHDHLFKLAIDGRGGNAVINMRLVSSAAGFFDKITIYGDAVFLEPETPNSPVRNIKIMN